MTKQTERSERKPNRYSQIIERIFIAGYTEGTRVVAFTREQIVDVAQELGINLPKNLGDVVYSFRYRTPLPETVRVCAPEGESWIILPAGRSMYRFFATPHANVLPNGLLSETKLPESTPGVIAKYALSDEQALLARLRYNRLVDIFTGVTCYSLQSHLRTTVPEMGQVETDEIYIGLDEFGIHYVFPVQAKGGSDMLSIVQVVQDVGLCQQKFPSLLCRPIAAQFMEPNLIALFSFEASGSEMPRLLAERHYRLVAPDQVIEDDLLAYRSRVAQVQ